MVTKNVVRGFSALAIVGFGLFSGVAFAAPGGAALSANACSNIDVSRVSQMTGTYLPGLSGNDCSTASVSQFAQMTGTYLPSTDGDTLRSVGVGIIPVTGATTAERVWRDAGASVTVETIPGWRDAGASR